ncbi:CobW family GTP-binding protein [Corallincola platygyrae]|uniref:CobW family GTP-binding protein n=1 Tax=Corallincola platygyrae TaxID=1193278 RepID=A0ABW4XJV1_9GAMM
MKIISKPIPTNVITGFLGVGKTSTILSLLAKKPANERWAVLVNEFGEVGIDKSLMASSQSQQEIAIKEVPGGCMCCTSGVPMHVALTQLIRQQKPDRLLIEPSGLGHPKEVLQSLTSDLFKGVLELRATVTLVDPRHLDDERYRTHDTYIQQLLVADRVIANKMDLAPEGSISKLAGYLAEIGNPAKSVSEAIQGEVKLGWLEPMATALSVEESSAPLIGQQTSSPTPEIDESNSELEVNSNAFTREELESDGFFSVSWRLPETWQFGYAEFFGWLNQLAVERVKGVINTSKGLYAFNGVKGVITSCPVTQTLPTALVLIDDKAIELERVEQSLISLSK